MKTRLIFLLIITCLSCVNAHDSPYTHEKNQVRFNLNSFSILPKEIDGCGCYFYKSEIDKQKGQYIFVSDFAKSAFISIDGQTVHFELSEHLEGSKSYVYIHPPFRLNVLITDKHPEAEESSKMKGIITLKRGNEEVTVHFIGSCGC